MNEEAFVILGKIFNQFLDKLTNSLSLDVEKEVTLDYEDNSKYFQIYKEEKIVFIDYMFFIKTISTFKNDKIDPFKYIEGIFNTNKVFEVIKTFKTFLNEHNLITNLNLKGNFEVRFYNYKNFKTISDMNSTYKNKLVTLRGMVFSRSRDIRHYVKKREMRCHGCSDSFIQIGTRWEKFSKVRKK